jgi:hypothetical protein
MFIISHRGNLDGPDLIQENKPQYVDKALSKGFEAELDVRFINKSLFLGHDEAQHLVSLSWLNKRKKKIWLHCKNKKAAENLKDFKSFCHVQDPFVYVTNGKIWVHDMNLEINNKCLIPLMSKNDLDIFFNKNGQIAKPYAICTDYPLYAKKYLVK